jgi:hypothetical protein
LRCAKRCLRYRRRKARRSPRPASWRVIARR